MITADLNLSYLLLKYATLSRFSLNTIHVQQALFHDGLVFVCVSNDMKKSFDQVTNQITISPLFK